MEIYEVLRDKIDEIIIKNDTENVDYIGINVDAFLNIKYKIYYLDRHYLSDNQIISSDASKLIDILLEKNLIGLVCPVDDNDNSNIERYEMKLSGRKNDQIHLFLDEVSKFSYLVKKNISEILSIGRMRNIQEEGYDFSSLYFFGMTLENQRISSIKFHYMTRLYERIGTNDSMEKFDNNYYIEYLRKQEIPQLESILGPIQKVIDDKLGNIYLFGIDYFANRNKKYKVYIKNDTCSLNTLCSLLEIAQISNIEKIIYEIRKTEKFFNDYSSIFFDGFALCNDTNGLFSVNLYFKFFHRN